MLQGERDVRSVHQVITTLWCYASSVAYIKRIGAKIILFADDIAQDWFSYLPYDDVITIYMPDDSPTCLWAAAKFHALQQMQLQDVHIDGDVFIKTQSLHNRIKYGSANSDLIIQSIEDKVHTANKFYTDCAKVVDTCGIEFLYNANNSHQPAYNCGLVGFNNEHLKQIYLQNYNYCHRQVADSPETIAYIKALGCWPDLLFEQKNLYDLAQGYNVFNLLGTGRKAYYNAIKYGYQHILGASKWKCLPDIKQQLKTVNLKIYNDTVLMQKKILAEAYTTQW